MKQLIVFISLSLMGWPALTQHKINVRGEQCSECNMFIKDPLFASIAIAGDEQYQFDAIECLVNFLREKDEATFDQLLVANYIQGGELIEARSAIYLKSKGIASPMGAYLSAYRTRSEAQSIQQEKGGVLYDWRGLKELFKDSRFGLLDHPTHHHSSPGSYAPVGVMGDHLHHRGGFMVSLRYMDMQMEGNLAGGETISDQRIFQDYGVAPQAMTMRMYMLGVMFAPSDNLTLMIMQNFVENSMDLQSMMAMSFSTESAGLGDTRVSVLYGLIAKEKMSLHVNSTVNIPSANIERRDDTPMVEDMKLPYPMQLGTGTIDLSVGTTYKVTHGKLHAGFQPMGTFRTGENGQGYRFGHQLDLNGWVSYDVASWLGVSGRVLSTTLGKIAGQDDELNPMMAPPANHLNSGFTRVRSFLGANFSFGHRPVFRDFKAGIEYGLPIYQDVKGVQMSESSVITAGIRYSI